MKTQEKISSEFNEFNEANYGSYPSSALIYFRRIFLNETSNDEDKIFQNWLLNEKFTISMKNDALYEKYISMYKFLFTYISQSDSNTIFSNLFKAIQRSVLNIEVSTIL
ncbi:uncharacterized protein LOC112592897 isoform X2 [Melanaphis sacchari]|uniref:uncharacterized protein LOC112592897 isoform X2 n=1 Tax=Melanaphis sacchari TaxID=742174 RepID=UPI000DC13FD4|nr:uncharacterized protein LOC112592897 isoform X2 [Melanaphis sacchari]